MNFSDLPGADRAVKFVQSCLLEGVFTSVYKELLNNSSLYELIGVWNSQQEYSHWMQKLEYLPNS